VTVSDVYRSLWRHKLLFVLLTACMGAAGWYLSSRQAPVYEATALVRVQQRISDPAEAFGALQTAGRLAQTYAHIATTLTIAQNVQRSLDGRVPLREIAGNIEAHQVEDIDLLALSAKAGTPQQARAIADRAPAALQQFIAQTGTTDDRITTVQRPLLPKSPISPKPMLALALALLLGVVLNGALLIGFDLLADRALEPDELEKLAGRPVIAVIPNLELTSIGALVSLRTLDGKLDDLDLRRAARG
jgi:capsular polysaccharide biosynthesis protein